MNHVVESRRAISLEATPLSAFRTRMGERTWLGYLRSATITGIAGRRRGLTGLALRTVLYPWLFAGATRPIVCEDVIVRGPRRIVLGDRVMLEQHVVLDSKTDREIGITIGDGAMLRVGCLIDTGYAGSVTIGAGSELGAYCELRGLGGITVGERCLFARNVMVVSSEHVIDDPATPITDQGNRVAAVTIGDGAWLGANAVVLGGVHIGAGAVVGANAVVREDVPSGAVVAGIPARVIRTRPDWVSIDSARPADGPGTTQAVAG